MDETVESIETHDLLDDEESGGGASRTWSTIYVLPFLLLGLADVLLLLWWGLEPLWGFMILPPILFSTVLAWIAFRSGFVLDHQSDASS